MIETNENHSKDEDSKEEELKKKMNPFEAYLPSLKMKEDSIKNGSLVIQKTTVSTGMNTGYPRFKKKFLREVCSGWLSDTKLQVIDLNYVRFPNMNGFVNALHLAFADDLEFTMTPDMLWTVIIQGFSQHINANAEKYRSKFVSHEGKKLLKSTAMDLDQILPKIHGKHVFLNLLTKLVELLVQQMLHWS